MNYMLTNFPWLSFVALLFGYLGLLFLALVAWTVLAECFKDWRYDRDLRRRIEKVDREING